MKHAILFTLSYHSRFSYPLTFDELHRFLVINRLVSPNELKTELTELINQKKITEKKDFYYLPNLPDLPDIRLNRQKTSQTKLRLARRAARLIGLLPWVKLICVTGSLAMENSDSGDDIDLMIVTAQNRLWLVRPFAILLISFFFKRRKPIPSSFVLRPSSFSNTLCLNLWLDSSALAMPPHRRNLRTAHELAQMKPLINKDKTYEKMLYQNRWAKNLLANFWRGVSLASGEESPWRTPRRLLIILNNLMNFLNLFLFRLQYAYMKPKITSEEVVLHSAFFHPRERY